MLTDTGLLWKGLNDPYCSLQNLRIYHIENQIVKISILNNLNFCNGHSCTCSTNDVVKILTLLTNYCVIGYILISHEN